MGSCGVGGTRASEVPAWFCVIAWLCLLFDHLSNATLGGYIPFHMYVCLLCTTKSILKIYVQVGLLNTEYYAAFKKKKKETKAV